MALSAEYYMMRKEAIRDLMETRVKQVDQVRVAITIHLNAAAKHCHQQPV